MRRGIIRIAVLTIAVALAVIATLLAPDRVAIGATVLMIFGVLLEYNLWRRRPASPITRGAITYGIPGIITLLVLLASSADARLGLTLTFAASVTAGAALGSIIEALAGGPRPALVRRQWRGIEHVGAKVYDVPVSFEIRALTAKVSASEVKRHRERFPKHPEAVRSAVQKGLFLVGWPVIALLIPVAFTDEKYVTGPDAPAQITGMAAFFSLLIVGYLVLGVLGARGWRQKTSIAEHMRLESFAHVNGLRYHPGPVLHTDGSALTRVMTSDSGWLLANAAKPQQQVSESVAPVTQYYGFAEYRFPGQLPHLFLSRKGVRPPAFASFTRPAPQQRLSLEGDFDRYFDTYCPRGYERDALYLLTPDVMAALIDGARNFDVEILGNRLILRTRTDLVTTDPAVWQTIAGAVSALAGRAMQWQKWRDDNDPLHSDVATLERDTTVTATRNRLRGTPTFGAILIGAFAAVYTGLVVLANTLGG